MKAKQPKGDASEKKYNSMQKALSLIAEDVTSHFLPPEAWMNFSNVSQAFREIAVRFGRISHFPEKSKPYFVCLGELHLVDWLRPSSPIECITPEVSEGIRTIHLGSIFEKEEDKVVYSRFSNEMGLFCRELDLKNCHDIEYVDGDLYLKEDMNIKNNPDLSIDSVKILLTNALNSISIYLSVGKVSEEKSKIVALFESDYKKYETEFESGISKATSERPYVVVFGGFFWDHSKQSNPPNEWVPKKDESVKFVTKDSINQNQNITLMNLCNFDKLVEIHEYGFACLYKLESLVVPNSLSVLGRGCFAFATALKSLKLDKTQIEVIPANAFLLSPLDGGAKPLILPPKLIKIDKAAFLSAKLTEIDFPESVENIGESAFKSSQFLQLDLSKTKIRVIDEAAFSNSPLVQLTLPRKLKTINAGAFFCATLSKLDIPESVENIGKSAFQSSQLSQLDLSKTKIRVIDEAAFKNSPLTQLTLPRKLTTIGKEAFLSAKLTEIDFPKSVEYIGEKAFQSSQLSQLDLSKTQIRVISQEAFKDSPLTQLTLPPTLRTINKRAFFSATLSKLDIPATVHYIGTYAFKSIGEVTATRGIKLVNNTFGNTLTDNIRWIDPPKTVGANQTDGVVKMEV